MDQRTESLKQEVDETREAMTEKLEAIEEQVYGTVDNLKGSTQETVEDIKQTAQEQIDTIKEKVDIQRLVDERPWTMLGASVLAGFVLGSMGDSDSDRDDYDYAPRRSSSYARRGRAYRYYDEHAATYDRPLLPERSRSGASDDDGEHKNGYDSSGYQERYYPADYDSGSSGSGFMANVRDQFDDEIDALKNAVVATATSTLRDLIRENFPRFANEFEEARASRERRHDEGTALHAQTPTGDREATNS